MGQQNGRGGGGGRGGQVQRQQQQQAPRQQQQAPRQQEQGGQLTVQEERKRMIAGFGSVVAALIPEMQLVLPKGGDAEKLRRIAITAVQKSPDLLDCKRETWITALMQCAQDGLMPDGREAAFVKMGGDVAYMPMVYGIRKKILQSGEIRDIFTAVVYQAEFDAGLFEVVFGSDPRIEHRPMLGSGERGEIIAAYSVATFKDGTKSFEVMTRADIDRVRAVSKAKRDDSPWNTWFGEMARKTVLRRHSKSLPMSSDHRDVEVESLIDPAAFARQIEPSAADQGLAGGPARSSQAPREQTRGKLDELEDRAFGGAGVAIDPPAGTRLDQGELVDEGTGEVVHSGNAPQAEQERRQMQVDPQASTDLDDTIPHQGGAPAGGDQGDGDDDGGEDGDAAQREADDREATRIVKRYNDAANIIDLRTYRDEEMPIIDSLYELAAGRCAKAFTDRSKAMGAGR